MLLCSESVHFGFLDFMAGVDFNYTGFIFSIHPCVSNTVEVRI